MCSRAYLAGKGWIELSISKLQWRNLFLVCIIAVCFLAAGCGEPRGSKYAVIVKTVDEIGNRLPNVTILYKQSGEQMTAKTDSDGLIELGQLQGTVTVSAAKNDWGFSPAEIRLDSSNQGDRFEFVGTQKPTLITIGTPLFKKIKEEDSLYYYSWELNLSNSGIAGKATVMAEYELIDGSKERGMLVESTSVSTLQKELKLSGAKQFRYELRAVKLTLGVLDKDGKWSDSSPIDAHIQ